MVNFVIVSHSRMLAESVAELTKPMAAGVKVIPAGGLEDGSFGTSYQIITDAIEKAYTEAGVLVLMDMGSAVMTAEMVLETMEDRKVKMVDCPMVEGAVAGTIAAAGGLDMERIYRDLTDSGYVNKF
ncbi:dihydroxyacetone kinase phosphoryl donor subunit DhaM [Clostridium boliviensis]|uniref:phosphoenolpyruvate--glycerone phosphotransferase n=1 Tax=Clostridium boliviensis TaxID=318465 RepID=A0ABU4GH10_9CLOT|nr:dihydroxyacetone kinase phosphoryl donor subunit DhaM [Clostridium boliviensis]MDW2796907.1 dihydroxyacetone kinase phosphoryl donor subunit DhaM [Clostridium boliviensis]